MYADYFAELLRSLASATSRREVLAGLTGGLFATRPLGFGGDDAAAKRKGKRKKKRKTKNKQKDQPASPPPPPPPPPDPVVRADASCPGPSDDPGIGGVIGDARRAQTFTALDSGPLVRAELLLSKEAGSFGDYILHLGAVDAFGAPTNEVLAVTSVANGNVPEGLSTVAFTFATPFSVVAGTAYALVLTRPGSEGSGAIAWDARAGDDCPGRSFTSFSQTEPFEPDLSDLDRIFTTFVRS